ncbi:M16 family metallopeptidase [Shewanella donghaensis]|uniref:M16 family metallopeptidase n=1 Tax=Shewanella donghaensis TaxID=238836 RepID=UPI001182E09D
MSAITQASTASEPKASSQCDLSQPLAKLHSIERQVTLTELENGLIIRQVHQPSLNTVSIASQFNVGSRNEKAGQTGYAHLFEHLLFKGSENAPNDSYPQQMSALGARFNASTHFDYTNYYLTIPAQALELSLFLESDRFIKPVLSATTVQNQQGAVLEEMATTIDNQPYIREAMEFLLSQVAGSQYGHAIIGSIEDVKSATAQELVEFHQRYYRPDAMQMSLVGQLNDKTSDWLEDYLGQWQNPDIPKQKFTKINIESSQLTATHAEIIDGRGPWPALLLAWHTVGEQDADFEAVSLLQSYLFQNIANALTKATLENPPHMLSYSVPLTMQNHGVTNLVLVPRANTSLDKLNEMVSTLLEKVASQGLEPRSLCQLKSVSLNDSLISFTDSQQLAVYLSKTSTRDKYFPLTQPWQRTAKVTSDDLKRVANQYFINKEVRLDLLPSWYIRWGKTLLEWLPEGFTESIEKWAL